MHMSAHTVSLLSMGQTLISSIQFPAPLDIFALVHYGGLEWLIDGRSCDFAVDRQERVGTETPMIGSAPFLLSLAMSHAHMYM